MLKTRAIRRPQSQPALDCCKARARARSKSDALGLAGVVGTLACFTAMATTAGGSVGITASTAMSAMAGMGAQGQTTSAPLGVLVDEGPLITAISVVLIALSLRLRRKAAVLPAFLGGGLIYWGMYQQADMPLMYVSLLLGVLLWGMAYVWARRATRQHNHVAHTSG